jgi:hypothetical protein
LQQFAAAYDKIKEGIIMQTKQVASQLKFDFPDEYCDLDPLLAKILQNDDRELVESANTAFQVIKETPARIFSGGLQLTILRNTLDNIAYHLWPISKRPGMNNVDPAIIHKNWEIYLLARKIVWQIEELLKQFINIESGAYLAEMFEENFFSSLQQKGVIEDIKTVHAWVKHLLKLTRNANQTEN